MTLTEGTLVRYEDETRVITGEAKTDRNGYSYYKTRKITLSDELVQKLDPQDVVDQTPSLSTSRMYVTFYW